MIFIVPVSITYQPPKSCDRVYASYGFAHFRAFSAYCFFSKFQWQVAFYQPLLTVLEYSDVS